MTRSFAAEGETNFSVWCDYISYQRVEGSVALANSFTESICESKT